MSSDNIVYPFVNPPHYVSDSIGTIFTNLKRLTQASNIRMGISKSNVDGEIVDNADDLNVEMTVRDTFIAKSNLASRNIYGVSLHSFDYADNTSYITLGVLANMYEEYQHYTFHKWFYTNQIDHSREIQNLLDTKPYLNDFVRDKLGIILNPDGEHSNRTKTEIITKTLNYFQELLFPHAPLEFPKQIDISYRYFEYKTHDLKKIEGDDSENVFSLRCKYLCVHQKTVIPICYNREKGISIRDGDIHHDYHTVLYDLLELPENFYFRYVSYWKENDLVLGHYDPWSRDVREREAGGALQPEVQEINRLLDDRDFYFYIRASDCRALALKTVNGNLSVDKLTLNTDLLKHPEEFIKYDFKYLNDHTSLEWVSEKIQIPRIYISLLRGPSKVRIAEAIAKSRLALKPSNYEITQHKALSKTQEPSRFLSNRRIREDPTYLEKRLTLSTLVNFTQITGAPWVNDNTGEYDRDWGGGNYNDDGRPPATKYFPYSHYLNMYLEGQVRQNSSTETISKILKSFKSVGNTKKSDKWQQICSVLKHGYKFDELKRIAKDKFKLTDEYLSELTTNSRRLGEARRVLCSQLAKLVYIMEKRAAKKVAKLQQIYREKKQHFKLPDVPCSNFTDECLSHESNYRFSEMQNNEYFVVAKPDMTFMCFHIGILDWARERSNRMCRYVQRSSRAQVSPDGTGSRPILGEYYYPLPLDGDYRIYIPHHDFMKICSRVKRTQLQYFYLGDAKMITLGNCQGTFGVSELHGQIPGEPVYPIQFIREREVVPRERTPEPERPQVNPHVESELSRIATRKHEILQLMGDIRESYDRYQDIAIEEELTDEQLIEQHPAAEAVLSRERQLRGENMRLSLEEMRLRSQLYNLDWRPPVTQELASPHSPPRSPSPRGASPHSPPRLVRINSDDGGVRGIPRNLEGDFPSLDLEEGEIGEEEIPPSLSMDDLATENVPEFPIYPPSPTSTGSSPIYPASPLYTGSSPIYPPPSPVNNPPHTPPSSPRSPASEGSQD